MEDMEKARLRQVPRKVLCQGSSCHRNGWSFFFAPFFFVPFFFGGWLVSAKTVPLLQAVAGKNVELLTSPGFCNPTPVLGLRVLQPNTSLRA